MVIGAFVRGLSMRDVESLCEKAGLGKLSKSTASRICQELRKRFEAFKRRDLTSCAWRRCSSMRRSWRSAQRGPQEGVLVGWGGSPRRANECCWR
jgi:hypothetical protein